MSDKKIISLADAGAPGRELLKAAGDLLNAVIQQYPRAAPSIMAGVTIQIRTAAGPVLEISGGAGPAAPAAPAGLILPGGSN